MHPATAQILDIRALMKVGYRFEPEDLDHWQWRALSAIDDAIEEKKAKDLDNARTKQGQVSR